MPLAAKDDAKVIDSWTGHTSVISEDRLPSVDVTSLNLYVLNLDRAPERLDRLSRQLVQMEIPFKRFQAVDGQNLVINDPAGVSFKGSMLTKKQALLLPEKKYSIICPTGSITYHARSHPETIKPEKRILSAGEFGCYCSHVAIWRNIVDSHAKTTLILEDDALLGIRFKESLKDVLSNLPAKWDIIYAYVDQDINDKNKRYRNDLTNIVDNPILLKYKAGGGQIWSTVAYFISLKGATKLLEISKIFSKPIDIVISDSIANGKINAYRTFERNVMAIPGYSYIGEEFR